MPQESIVKRRIRLARHPEVKVGVAPVATSNVVMQNNQYVEKMLVVPAIEPMASASTSLQAPTPEAALPVKYLVLSGGGAKGVQYSGVYDALSRSGAMKGIDAIAGSSAGAISAAWIATGMGAVTFKATTKGTDLLRLLGKEGISMISKDGTPLYDLLDNSIRDNFSDFLETNDITTLSRQRMSDIEKEQAQNEKALEDARSLYAEYAKEAANLTSQMSNAKDEHDIITIRNQIKEFEMGAKIALQDIGDLQLKTLELEKNYSKVQSILEGRDNSIEDLRQKCAEGGKILFKDLDLMRLIAPQRFKDLYVTATNKKTGELKIFNSKDTPDVEIALACRASASIPIVFQPVTIDGEKYVDGGYRDNTPYNYFKKEGVKSDIEKITNDQGKITQAKAQGRTMAFVFENDTSKVALYSAKEKIFERGKIGKFLTKICDRILSKVVGGKSYSESVEKTYKHMRDHSMETVGLNTKGTGTLDFVGAKRKQKYLHAAGYVQTANYLAQHELSANGKGDPNIKHEVFFLEVCDKIEKRKPHDSWVSKIVTKREVKQEALIDFCMPQKWENRHPDAVLREFVLLSSISRKDNEFTASTTAIDSLLSTLNKKTTSDSVKQDFARVLSTPERPIKVPEDITKLQFSKKDIERFIATNKDLPIARSAHEALSSGGARSLL